MMQILNTDLLKDDGQEKVIQVWDQCCNDLTSAIDSAFTTDFLNNESKRAQRFRLEPAKLKKVVKYGLLELMVHWLLDEVSSRLLHEAVPQFDKYLSLCEECDEDDVEECMRQCILYIHSLHTMLENIFKSLRERTDFSRLCIDPLERLGLQLRVMLFPDATAHDRFTKQVRRYLEIKFTTKYSAWKKIRNLKKVLRREEGMEQSDSADTSDDEDGHNALPSAETSITESFNLQSFGRCISEIGWTGTLEECFIGILYKQTERRITRTCKDNFERPLLQRVLEWLHDFAISWLKDFIGKGTGPVDPTEQWTARLEFHVYETLCKLRTKELFGIVTDFPDSSPALDDLKTCLARTHQHRQLVAALREAFAQRLLHPGANTAQILDVYISAIKSLRLLDSSGVLLEAISEPIKEYLRKREDTVRCIVTSLTDDSNSELFEELGRGGDMRPIEHGHEESDAEDEIDNVANPESWTPDPIEADPRKTARSRKSNDILSMLVHIYGSKELFVNEYRLVLADKLLSNTKFDTDREVRNLELLKLRFGDSSMHNCEIMVKDVSDSKRTNANVAKHQLELTETKRKLDKASTTPSTGRQTRSSARLRKRAQNMLSDLKGEDLFDDNQKTDSKVSLDMDDFSVIIVSKQFWPTLHGEELKLHYMVQAIAERFAYSYHVLKNPRQLVWKPNLGTVTLDLEFDNGQTRNYTVSTCLATLIMHVADQESVRCDDLARLTGVESAIVEKRMGFWVNQGVVEKLLSVNGGQRSVTYKAVEAISEDHESTVVVEEDGGAQSAVSADVQLAEEMAVYESYVTGMLMNHDSLPAERIHNVLKLVLPSGEHKYDKTIQELETFLNKLVNEEKVEYTNGSYQIKKHG